MKKNFGAKNGQPLRCDVEKLFENKINPTFSKPCRENGFSSDHPSKKSFSLF